MLRNTHDDMFVTRLNTKGLEKANHFYASHMELLLDYFYTDIIVKKQGYRVLCKEDALKIDKYGESKTLSKYEIVKISLGDSRHIAIQNMILNGCNILTAKGISGHESADMVFHYAGNIKNLIKCRAYSLYEMSKQQELVMPKVTKTNATILCPTAEVPHIEVDEGECFSLPFVLDHEPKDCFAVAGNCDDCRYFKSKEDSLIIRKKQEKDIEKRIARINIWLNSTRTNKHEDEFTVMSNQLAACVENLQNAYIHDLEEGVKI